MAIPQYLSYKSAFLTTPVKNAPELLSYAGGVLTAAGWDWGGGEEYLIVMYGPVLDGKARLRITLYGSTTTLAVVAVDHLERAINSPGGKNTYIKVEAPTEEEPEKTTTVDIFAGPNYFFITSYMDAYPDTIGVWIFDNAPSPGIATPLPCYGATVGPYRFDTGTINKGWNNCYISNPFCPRQYYGSLYGVAKQPMGGTTNQFRFMTMSGAYMFEPWQCSYNGHLLGCVPNCLMTDYSIPPGSILSVPVDTGVNKYFRVLGLLPYSTYANRICVKMYD